MMQQQEQQRQRQVNHERSHTDNLADLHAFPSREEENDAVEVLIEGGNVVIQKDDDDDNKNAMIMRNNKNSKSTTPTRLLLRDKIWVLPWIVFLGVLYWFTILWINMAIIQKYFIHHNWNAALPGLDTTLLRKYTMAIHFTAGSLCLVLGPFQFVPIIRKYTPLIHRWIGRLYVVCAIVSSIFGLIFICLKKGKLVGGYNMAIAFTLSGSVFGIFALKVWQTARIAKTSIETTATISSPKMETIQSNKSYYYWNIHRNWAIRSYSQILAPMLYRYWHVTLEIFRMYPLPNIHSEGACNTEDLCKDFFRLFDQIHVWTYWLSSWLVAEIIIYFLKRHDNDNLATTTHDSSAAASPASLAMAQQQSGEDPERAPLLINDKAKQQQQQYSSPEQELSVTDPNTVVATSTSTAKCGKMTPAMSLNMIGSILAIIFSVITIKMFT